MKRSSKIGKKFFCGMSVLILVPILIVGYTSIRITLKVFEDTIRLTSLQTTQIANSGFQNFLNSITTEMDMLCGNDDITTFTKEDNPENIERILNKAKKSKDNILDIRYGLVDGDTFINTSTYSQGSSYYKDEDWYKNAGTSLNISDPYFRYGSSSSIITITKQVKDNAGTVGVLAMDIDSNSVKDYISNISILNTGYVLITDNKGNIIINNSKNNVFEGDVTTLPFYEQMSSDDVGFYKYDNAENPLYIVQFPINNTNWKLVGVLSQSESSSKTKPIKNAIFIIAVICIIIAFLIAFILVKHLVKMINHFKESMEKMSHGDLSFLMDITRNDEIGELQKSFNKMIKKVSSLINEMNSTALNLIDASVNINSMSEEISASASGVSTSTDNLSQGSLKQAEAANEGAEKVEELSVSIENINNHILNISDLSSKADKLSCEGIKIVDELVENSAKTKENTIHTSNVVSDLTDSIKEIMYISDTILNITEQTSLLSLNASIEAARAGESGKGFAVVANEIRNLADESKSATDNIKNIVAEINNKAFVMQESVHENSDIIEAQNKCVDKTGTVFQNIADSIKVLLDAINDMTYLNDKMRNDKAVVKDDIDHVNEISNETASLSEEIASSVQEVSASMEELASYAVKLNEISEKLKKEMNRFKL